MKTLQHYLLKAKSKRNAFYDLSLREFGEMYIVHKESGANGKVLNKHEWLFYELEKARDFFSKKLNEKTNVSSGRTRKYEVEEY